MASQYLTLPIEGGKYYHVCKYSSYDGPIFCAPGNYPFFLKRFQTLLGPMVDLLAYCLLPNSFHFVFYAREVITIKEEYVDHPGDIGHFISETLRKLFTTYGITLIKQEGFAQDQVILDQNFLRFELTDDETVRNVISAIHCIAQRESLSGQVGQYAYDSYQSIVAKGKSMLDKELVFSLFGDKEQFLQQSTEEPQWSSSPLFAERN
jgi:putative transposase